jgi:hypothetical protein
VKNAAVLLKNAATFYKGAEASAQSTGLKDEATEAMVKSTLVKALQVRALQCPSSSCASSESRALSTPQLSRHSSEAYADM